MNTVKIATLALASAGIALSAPLAAQDRMQDQDRSILVQPTSEETYYATQVARKLDRNLARYNFPLRTRTTGIVRVQFNTNADGDPENLTLIGESRNNQLDRAALWAVRRMSDVAPNFAGGSSDRPILANIVFADTERQAERMFARLAREESVRIAQARERGDPPVLVLNVGGALRAN